MKDYTQADFEDHMPSVAALQAVQHCLDRFYAEKHKNTNDMCVHDLSYEEVIGALCVAKDSILHEQELFERSTMSFRTTNERAEEFEKRLHKLVNEFRHEPSGEAGVIVQWTTKTPESV